jgi:hypothetical protein
LPNRVGVPHPSTGIEPRCVSSSSWWAMTSCRPPCSRGPGRRPGTTTRRPGRCWSALGSPPIAGRLCGRADPTRLRGAPTWRTSPRDAHHRAPPARTNRPGAGACPGSRRAPFRVGGRARRARHRFHVRHSASGFGDRKHARRSAMRASDGHTVLVLLGDGQAADPQLAARSR